MEKSYNLYLPKSQFDDFHLNFCGKAECGSQHSFGPFVRSNYLIHYVTKGKGVYKVGKNIYEIEGGKGFLIEPNILTYYEADKDDPWEYIWISFSGKNASVYLNLIGLGNGNLVFKSSYGNELVELIEKMFDLNSKFENHSFLNESVLFSFFEILAREKQNPNLTDNEYENDYVRQAMDFVKENYTSEITVKDIAHYVNIDRSYLYNLFMRYKKISPQDYLTNYRMAYAKEMLCNTDYSVYSICCSCGYTNTTTFSKAFKRNVGLSPLEYRKSERAFHSVENEKVKHIKD